MSIFEKFNVFKGKSEKLGEEYVYERGQEVKIINDDGGVEGGWKLSAVIKDEVAGDRVLLVKEVFGQGSESGPDNLGNPQKVKSISVGEFEKNNPGVLSRK